MQNAGKIKETVVYYGEDLYMLETLIVWPGEFKRIYKKQKKNKTQGAKQVQDINA